MKIPTHAALAAAVLAVISAGAFGASKPEGWRDINRYEKAAGESVTTMPLQSLVDWQALSDHSLAIWTAHDKPWLVGVESPCNAGLESADDIGLTSEDGSVKTGTDYVEVGSRRCRITSIQPVDYRQVASISKGHVHHQEMARTTTR